MSLILYEIPISHDCTKVRTALKMKSLPYRSLPIPPTDRTRLTARIDRGVVLRRFGLSAQRNRADEWEGCR
jgi:hypothetical protein